MHRNKRECATQMLLWRKRDEKSGEKYHANICNNTNHGAFSNCAWIYDLETIWYFRLVYCFAQF